MPAVSGPSPAGEALHMAIPEPHTGFGVAPHSIKGLEGESMQCLVWSFVLNPKPPPSCPCCSLALLLFAEGCKGSCGC